MVSEPITLWRPLHEVVQFPLTHYFHVSVREMPRLPRRCDLNALDLALLQPRRLDRARKLFAQLAAYPAPAITALPGASDERRAMDSPS